jgi:hypothetical protein
MLYSVIVLLWILNLFVFFIPSFLRFLPTRLTIELTALMTSWIKQAAPSAVMGVCYQLKEWEAECKSNSILMVANTLNTTTDTLNTTADTPNITANNDSSEDCNYVIGRDAFNYKKFNIKCVKFVLHGKLYKKEDF